MYNPHTEAAAQLTLAVVKEMLEHKVAAKAILAVIEAMSEQKPAVDPAFARWQETPVEKRLPLYGLNSE